MVVRRLLAVLLVFGGGLLALLALTPSAGAEDPSDEAALAAYELRWTRFPEHNPERNKEGAGNAVWGGGSFLKLIGKLAVDGCNVDAIAIYDLAGERMLFSHHFQAPDFVNVDFDKGEYLKEVPSGSVLAFTCVDACDILIGPGASEADDWPGDCMSVEEYAPLRQIDTLFHFVTGCGTDFTSEVNDHFTTRVPMFQDVCIIYFSRKASESKPHGVAYQPFQLNASHDFFVKFHVPFILVNNDDLSPERDWGYFLHRRLIMHELCHMNQFWYRDKFYNTYDNAKLLDRIYWNDTMAGREFREVLGYRATGYQGNEPDQDWYLPEDSPYYVRGYYTQQPEELAGEVCANLALAHIYANEYPEIAWGQQAVKERFLTAEIRAWVRKYMLVD